MKGVVRRSHQARSDLIAISRNYAVQADMKVAERFLAVAEAAFVRLAATPLIGTRHEFERPGNPELRYFPLPSRFKKYLVFYHPRPDGIEVARVLHGARDLMSILEADTDGDED